MTELEVRGHRLHVSRRKGRGVTLFTLCSSGVDLRQWGALLRAIPDRPAVGFNYLGYPPSDLWRGQGAPDISIDAEAAERLLLQEPDPVDLVGHSYGGFLALHLARKHPERVRRIVMHEATAWGCLWASPNQGIRDEFADLLVRLLGDEEATGRFPERFVDYWNVPGAWAALPEERKAAWRVLAPKIQAEVDTLCYDKTRPEVYREVTHPVTMTVGRDTPAHQAEVCRILVEMLPNVRRVDVPGGHMGVITHAAEVLPHLVAALL